MTILQIHHKLLLEMAQSLLETGVLTGEVIQSYLDRLAVTPPAPDPDAKADDARDQGRMVVDQEKLEPS